MHYQKNITDSTNLFDKQKFLILFFNKNLTKNITYITMKKIAFIFALATMSFVTSSFNTTNTEIVTPVADVCFKIKNDSGKSITFHTGKGTVPVNSGVVKEFCLPEGAALYLADKGQKGKAIITADAKKVGGKTFKFSEL